jgi:hypothetical protein
MLKIKISIIILVLILFSCSKRENNENLTILTKNDILANNEQAIKIPITGIEIIDDIEWENKIKKYIFFAFFEPIEYSFNNKPGSSLYIERFNLSKNDIQIIGGWYQPTFTDFFNYIRNADGPGIGINFLPNRKLVIFQNGNNRHGQNYYLIGNWKIHEYKLFINIEYRIGNIKYEEIEPIQGRVGIKSAIIEKLEFSNDFVEIFNIEKYDFAYINKNPFDFSNFDSDLKHYLFINDVDQIRYRGLQDEMGSYWDYMDEKYELGYFLLNNKIETEEETFMLLKLITYFRKEKE